jgi:hypothetical protein
MLQKMTSPEKRANELKLLAEYEAAGKIRRIDYVKPTDVDDDSIEKAEEATKAREASELRRDLGDGNFRIYNRPKY